MDSEEREIFDFLTTWGSDFVSYKEIARRAGGKKKYYEDPDWAKSLLARLLERGVLEGNSQGRYRIKPLPAKNKATRWVSPDIAKILHENGVKIDGAIETGTEDYYEGL